MWFLPVLSLEPGVAEKYQPRMARAMIVWKLAGPADSHSRRSVTLAWRNRPPAAHDLFGGVFVVLRPSIVMLYMAYCSPPIPPLLRDKAMLCIGGHSQRWMTRVCAVVRSERRRDRPWYVKNGKNKEGGGVYDGGPVIGRDLGMVA